MCTLTFVSGLPGGGYLLAVNRDESPRRALATPPVLQRFGARAVIAPRDPDGHGTWIGVDDTGHCVAILNGDRPPAPGAPPGSRPSDEDAPVSRGLLVHDLLEDPRFDSVRHELARRQRLDALHYKPFKLVVVAPGPGQGGRAAHILRADWDGTLLRMEETQGPRCVVSSSHETDAVTGFRRAAFDGWLASQSRAIEALAAAAGANGANGANRASAAAPSEALATALESFQSSHHPQAPQGDARSVCMHRADANTVSSTLVLVTPSQVVVRYRAGHPCQQPPVASTAMARAG